MTKPTPAKPFLKWAGGKTRLTKEILRRLPSNIDTYYEPFVGSGAVFFALASEGRFRRAALSDRNSELIDVYRALKRDVDQVIEELRKYTYDKDVYYEARKKQPQDLELFARAARTIYLNKTGFNGLYRVNRSGQFNVPFGRYTNPNFCDEPRLRAAALALKKARLYVKDFESACKDAKPGDAVYFDPPYVPISSTSNFTAYHQDAFGEAEHQRLAQLFDTLTKRGVPAVLSNSDTPLTRELYKPWQIDSLSVLRMINSVTTRRGGVSELLVSNQSD